MAPVVRNVDIFRRWITAACMVFIAFVCASCATTGRPFDASITAQGIVSRHAESAFDVWFDQELAKDREVLNRFFEATKDAQTKADLTRAWQAIRELDTEHPDFLEKRIFSKAAGDGDWPGSDPPLDQKEVFVNGVRQALNKFLEEVETPSHVEIPDLYGRALQQAKSVLPRELPLGRVTFRESDRPEGTIIDQNPRAGARVAPGTAVNVVIARAGAALLAVGIPSLSGRTVQEVTELLARSGLRVGRVTRRHTGRVRPGTVIDQQPRAGEEVARNTAVDLVVAEALPVVPVKVPPVIKMPEREAAAILRRSGLQVGRVTFRESDRPEGTIIDQNPRAGARVAPGTAVNVVIARAGAALPSAVMIPDLSGRTVQEAKSVLPRELRLEVTVRESDRPEGTIIDQNPRAGARVAPGTVVNVVKATSGAAPPVSPAVGISDRGTTLEALKWKLLAVGLGLILLILVIAVLIPHPTPFQYIVFRTTLALAAACVASALPGFFEFNPEVPKAGIAAGGALAVFVLVYMWNPGRIIGKNEENS